MGSTVDIGKVVWVDDDNLSWWPALVVDYEQICEDTSLRNTISANARFVQLFNVINPFKIFDISRLKAFIPDKFYDEQVRGCVGVCEQKSTAISQAFLRTTSSDNNTLHDTPVRTETSDEEGFAVGTVLWVDLDGYPWWPARVVTKQDVNFSSYASDDIPPSSVIVQFFNDNNRFTVISRKRTAPFRKDEFYDVRVRFKGAFSRDVKIAMNEAWDYLGDTQNKIRLQDIHADTKRTRGRPRRSESTKSARRRGSKAGLMPEHEIDARPSNLALFSKPEPILVDDNHLKRRRSPISELPHEPINSVTGHQESVGHGQENAVETLIDFGDGERVLSSTQYNLTSRHEWQMEKKHCGIETRKNFIATVDEHPNNEQTQELERSSPIQVQSADHSLSDKREIVTITGMSTAINPIEKPESSHDNQMTEKHAKPRCMSPERHELEKYFEKSSHESEKSFEKSRHKSEKSFEKSRHESENSIEQSRHESEKFIKKSRHESEKSFEKSNSRSGQTVKVSERSCGSIVEEDEANVASLEPNDSPESDSGKECPRIEHTAQKSTADQKPSCKDYEDEQSEQKYGCTMTMSSGKTCEKNKDNDSRFAEIKDGEQATATTAPIDAIHLSLETSEPRKRGMKVPLDDGSPGVSRNPDTAERSILLIPKKSNVAHDLQANSQEAPTNQDAPHNHEGHNASNNTGRRQQRGKSLSSSTSDVQSKHYCENQEISSAMLGDNVRRNTIDGISHANGTSLKKGNRQNQVVPTARNSVDECRGGCHFCCRKIQENHDIRKRKRKESRKRSSISHLANLADAVAGFVHALKDDIFSDSDNDLERSVERKHCDPMCHHYHSERCIRSHRRH